MWRFIEKWPYLREKKLVKLSLFNCGRKKFAIVSAEG